MAGQVSFTRKQYVESIRQLSAAAAELAGSYSMNQLTWQPRGGEGWSMLECLDHVAISARVYLDAMGGAVTDARPGADADTFRTAGLPSEKFLASIEPPASRKMPAPAKIRPRATLNPEGILPAFLETMDRVTALVAATSGRDLNAVRFRNPLFPLMRFTVGTGLLILAAHGRRHLWQAERVAQEPDFPD